MAQAVVRVSNLPERALEAASVFYGRGLTNIRRSIGPETDTLVLLLPDAPYDHRAWRCAMVQDLARALAPIRVNAIAGGSDEAIAATLAWLERAPGVTGQLLKLDGKAVADLV